MVTTKTIAILAGHDDDVAAVAVSGDGKWLATGSADKTVRLWELATGRLTASLVGHTDLVVAVTFSSDSRWLATGGADKTARLWDVATGKPLATLEGHTRHYVTSVAFSADGNWLATGSDDNTARLWTLLPTTQSLVDEVKTSVPRCLTPAQREAFHLSVTPPRWCFERHLWPYQDQPSPPLAWDEQLVAAWDRVAAGFANPAVTAARSIAVR